MKASIMKLLVAFWFSLVIGTAIGSKKRYDGYQLLQVDVINERHREVIQQLSEDVELDFWREAPNEVDIFVSGDKVQELMKMFFHEHMVAKVKVSDMQQLVDAEERELKERRVARNQAFNYNDFNTLEDIHTELDELVTRCPAGLTCDTVIHGRTAGDRNIKGIRIRRTDRTQKIVWIDATIHAREWLATGTNLKIIRHIVEDYSNNSTLRALVDRYAWYLLPVVNSDGYSFTWSNDRLWRKNRTANPGSICIGTDLNRNFAESQWGTSGSSTNPCSETFRGVSAGSELEVQAMQAAHNALGRDMLLSINLHTYGRMWLNSWSYQLSGSCYIGPDHNDLITASNAAADAIERTWGTTWTRGPFCLVLYSGSGTSIDYAKANSGVKYTFLPELRGNNFVISNTEIEPSFVEVWNGVVAAINAVEIQG